MKQQAIDAGIAAAGHKVTQVGGGIAVTSGIWGWMANNHNLLASIGVVVGITLALAGFATQYVFQKRRDAREQELHREKLFKLIDKK